MRTNYRSFVSLICVNENGRETFSTCAYPLVAQSSFANINLTGKKRLMIVDIYMSQRSATTIACPSSLDDIMYDIRRNIKSAQEKTFTLLINRHSFPLFFLSQVEEYSEL